MKTIILATAVLLSGCATQMTMTGKAYDPVDPLSVKILFNSKPNCIFEELGFITTPLAWNQNRAVQLAREKAAEVGADYITIQAVHTAQFNDTSISAMAYKCGVVDRDKAELSPK